MLVICPYYATNWSSTPELLIKSVFLIFFFKEVPSISVSSLAQAKMYPNLILQNEDALKTVILDVDYWNGIISLFCGQCAQFKAVSQGCLHRGGVGVTMG